MDIKWSYYLIAALYVLLIVLRVINSSREKEYKKVHEDAKKVFSIKKDFFTTVTLICILVTIAINCAALIGGEALNTSSMLITLLVIGLMVLNSFTYILYSEKKRTVYFIGYTLAEDDIEQMDSKLGNKKNKLVITFTKEVEGYNYSKLLVFGKHKESLTCLLDEMTKKQETNK